MNQPLGCKVGNWLEVEESLDALQGYGPGDVMEVTHQLAGTMIFLGGKAETIEEGIEKSEQSVSSGHAWQKWLNLVNEQGGDITYLKHPEKQKKTNFKQEIKSSKKGYIQSIDAYKIGMASLELGAGRKTKDDKIDPLAGIILNKKVGDPVERGEKLLTCQTNKETNLTSAKEIIDDAIAIGKEKPELTAMVTHRVDSSGVQGF